MAGVAVLGATGMVGQRLVAMLRDHPFFELRALCASDRSAGRPYAEAAPWRLEGEEADWVADWRVRECRPEALPDDVDIVLSALPTGEAKALEPVFAEAGLVVVSNAGAYRQDPRVPLIIPEINPDHLAMTATQPWAGALITNPNCCAVPLAMALAPLHAAFGVEAACVSTWQAVSGAGYPGESAWDMVGNVHPHPGDEEEKLGVEPQKILGAPGAPASFVTSARCVRVNSADGHLVSAQLSLRGNPSPERVMEALRDFTPRGPALPSSPTPLFHFSDRRDRPAPRFDAGRGRGMTVTIGRVEACAVMGVKLYALAHNTVRGAAGAALANAELWTLQAR
ncbi:MAG: hypothetical protein RIT28_4190 [Pseudomonadota bacterium]